MDRLHNTMVKQMEDAEDILDQEAEQRRQVIPPTPTPARRKTSVSTACQTDKVSRKVSHIVRVPRTIPSFDVDEEKNPMLDTKQMSDTEMTPTHDTIQEMSHAYNTDMTPVTRCLSHLSTKTRRGSPAPKTISEEETVAGGVRTLKDCNNLLVSFIERARVLAEAEEIKQSFPQSLYVINYIN